jgi:transcriptional regulator with XRE-family HTH domain
MEPFTLGALGAVALTEGVKFLYGQAGEILKRRRERKKAAEEGRDEGEPEPLPIEDPGILEGELEPAVIDFEAVDRLEEDLKVFSQQLGNYASGIEEVDPSDEELLHAADALRRALEAIYQQRITFQGEERPPSGPLVEGRVDVEEVAGYTAGVRAEAIESGRVTGELKAKRVEPGGEAIGVDAKRIGGRGRD